MRLPLIKKFDTEVADVVMTATTITDEYTAELDRCMIEVKELLAKDTDIPGPTLNYYIATLPILIYELSNRVMELGIKSDAAKMQRKQVYNETYLNTENGTVAKKTGIAQQACQNEQFIEDIFSRVYKNCENKIEVATMLHGSLKKVQSWQVAQIDLTKNTNLFR